MSTETKKTVVTTADLDEAMKLLEELVKADLKFHKKMLQIGQCKGTPAVNSVAAYFINTKDHVDVMAEQQCILKINLHAERMVWDKLVAAKTDQERAAVCDEMLNQQSAKSADC
jgi:hypothetical protein